MKQFKLLVAAALVMGCMLCVAAPIWAQEAGKVNINTASIEELASLDRVGMKTAARIVEYRNTAGMFTQPEDLMNVKGIGKKIFELNKDRIVVGSRSGASQGKDKNVSQRQLPTGKKG